jgi:hypothetical protein
MQRDGGFSMKTLDPVTWLVNKIHELRKYTTREIVIRPHPGKFDMADFAKFQSKEYVRQHVRVINPLETTLLENLQSAHAAVFFNSSASVAAVLEGVPVWVDDASAVTQTVAHHDMSTIESPQQFSTDQWIHDLATAHWSDQDGKTGLIYQKFLPYLN